MLDVTYLAISNTPPYALSSLGKMLKSARVENNILSLQYNSRNSLTKF